MLVVQVVKEINELRYVLCPKRMTDAQFWQIYFRLADKYMPEEASDPNYMPPASSSMQGLTLTDLQVRTFSSPAQACSGNVLHGLQWSQAILQGFHMNISAYCIGCCLFNCGKAACS